MGYYPQYERSTGEEGRMAQIFKKITDADILILG